MYEFPTLRRPAQSPVAPMRRSRLSLFAVEPRMLFDGAAAATLDAAHGAHPGDGAAAVHTEASAAPTLANSPSIQVKTAAAPGSASAPRIALKTSGPTANADSHFTYASQTITDGQAIHGAQQPWWQADAADSGTNLQVTGVQSGVASGSASGHVGQAVAGAYGTLTMAADGSYSYVVGDGGHALPRGQSADDVFSYTVTDSGGLTSTTTVTIHVIGTNHAPTATGNARDVSQDGSITDGKVLSADGYGNPPASDIDGDHLDVAGVTGGVCTDASYQGGVGQAIHGQYGTLVMNSDGTYVYTPDSGLSIPAGQNAQDVFSYMVCDQNAGGAAAQLTITLHGSSGPRANPDEHYVYTSQTISNGQAITGARENTWQVDNADVGTGLHVTGVQSGAGTGDATGHVGQAVSGTYGSLTLNADGSYAYVVDPHTQNGLVWGQQVQDVFTYTVTDAYGHAATTTITIRVLGSNNPPEAVPHTRDIGSDQSINDGKVLQPDGHGNGADFDRDGNPLHLTGVVAGTTNTVPRTGLGETIHGNYGDLVLNTDGTYVYVPHANLNLTRGQTVTDTFSYLLCDDMGGDATGTIQIVVHGPPGRSPHAAPPIDHPPGVPHGPSLPIVPAGFDTPATRSGDAPSPRYAERPMQDPNPIIVLPDSGNPFEPHDKVKGTNDAKVAAKDEVGDCVPHPHVRHVAKPRPTAVLPSVFAKVGLTDHVAPKNFTEQLRTVHKPRPVAARAAKLRPAVPRGC